MGKRSRGGPHGLLVVDKARGPTSHDVVFRARKALGTRRIGHAGTLDPMATGVLVLLLGEGTKLVPYLTADDKVYTATLQLGTATHSLDAEGEVTERKSVPPLNEAGVRAALEAFVGDHPQVAPAVSAIKVDGKPLHARVRAGEQVTPPTRDVSLHKAELLGLADEQVRMRLHCGKGYYVRALARDLAEALGTVGHLVQLRREQSGPLTLEQGLDFELLCEAARGQEGAQQAARSACWDLTRACKLLPGVVLDAQGAEHARQGRAVPAECWAGTDTAPDGPCVLWDGDGRPIAIAQQQEGALRVRRGFVTEEPAAAP